MFRTFLRWEGWYHLKCQQLSLCIAILMFCMKIEAQRTFPDLELRFGPNFLTIYFAKLLRDPKGCSEILNFESA